MAPLSSRIPNLIPLLPIDDTENASLLDCEQKAITVKYPNAPEAHRKREESRLKSS